MFQKINHQYNKKKSISPQKKIKEEPKKSQKEDKEEDNEFLEKLLNQHSVTETNTLTEESIISTVFLTNLGEMIESINNNPQKIIDILLILKGACSSVQSNELLEKIIHLHHSILTNLSFNSSIQEHFLNNLITLLKKINNLKQNKTNFDRKFLILLEFFLMKDQENLLTEHLIIIIKILNKKIDSTTQNSIFPFAFLFLKVLEISKQKFYYKKLRLYLSDTKKAIYDKLPDSSEGHKLRSVLDEHRFT